MKTFGLSVLVFLGAIALCIGLAWIVLQVFGEEPAVKMVSVSPLVAIGSVAAFVQERRKRGAALEKP